MTRQDDQTPHNASPAGSPWTRLFGRRDFRGGILALASGIIFVLFPAGRARSATADPSLHSDEGAILGIFALCFLLPIGMSLVAAAVALWRGRRWGRAFHYVALLWPGVIVALYNIYFGR